MKQSMKGDDYSKETLITDSSEHWTIFSSSFGMDQVIFMSRKWEVTIPWVITTGTGPLACLSLFSVAEVDKVSND